MASEDAVRIVVDSPSAGDVVRGRTDLAPLSGVATAGGRPTSFDLMLVVDVSGSTRYPSGIDIDGDGELGRQKAGLVAALDTINTDPDDSILAAEVAGAIRLLDQLDPERVRVGVVSFSGEIDPATGRRRSFDQVDSLLEHPLSSNFESVEQALEAVRLRGPHGGTNMEAGVKHALREVAGLGGAQSVPRNGAKKIILLMTDGKPSLPFGRADVEDPEDVAAVVAAAELARSAGITINVFGLGPNAIDYPQAATAVAGATAGLYTPVRRPGDIVSLLSGVSFANVEDVVAVNLTLGEWAGPNDILLRPDGSFRGFVPVRPGVNRIRVSALASDGTRGSTELDILFKHQDLTDGELELELERIRDRSRGLELLMERERQEAFRKRERERTLSIEVDERDEESQP
ncbi:MAG: vWA domain-containing protein [Myxococcota bacterium]